MKRQILALLVGLAAVVMAWIFYGWQMPIILTLAIWGNNLSKE